MTEASPEPTPGPRRALCVGLGLLVIAAWCWVVYPMTAYGYGADHDAWRVVIAADRMAEEGHYVKSRTTGFPLFELGTLPLIRMGGSAWSNLFAMASGIALLLALMRLWADGRLRHPVLVMVAIGFAPIMLKNSSCTMDYVPAIALLAWGYRALLAQHFKTCALLVGLACGFRVTSGLFLLPCLFYAMSAVGPGARLRTGWEMGTTACAVAILVFSPVLTEYSLGQLWGGGGGIERHLGAKERHLHYPLLLLGQPQTVALLALLLLGVVVRIVRRRGGDVGILIFHTIAILLWTGLFYSLSNEPDYLLPALPSVILMADRLLSRWVLLALVAGMMTYHQTSVDILDTPGETSDGYTVSAIGERQHLLELRDLAATFKPPKKTVLLEIPPWMVAGHPDWTLKGRVWERRDGMFSVAPLPKGPRIEQYLADGYRVGVLNAHVNRLPRDPGIRSRVAVFRGWHVLFGVKREELAHAGSSTKPKAASKNKRKGAARKRKGKGKGEGKAKGTGKANLAASAKRKGKGKGKGKVGGNQAGPAQNAKGGKRKKGPPQAPAAVPLGNTEGLVRVQRALSAVRLKPKEAKAVQDLMIATGEELKKRSKTEANEEDDAAFTKRFMEQLRGVLRPRQFKVVERAMEGRVIR